MKKIFVMAALSLAAISCTKSDVLDSPVLNQKISFNTYLGKAAQTKATVENAQSMVSDGFNVIAFKNEQEGLATTPYMDVKLYGVTSNTQEGTEGTNGTETTNLTWKYNGDYFWPIDGSRLTFGSYGLNVNLSYNDGSVTDSQYNQGGTDADLITFSEGSKTEFTYKVPQKVSDQQDLLVANTVTPDAGTTVMLKYKHLLSRIGFSIKSSAPKDVILHSLSLEGDIIESGKVNLLEIADQTDETEAKGINTNGFTANKGVKYEFISETDNVSLSNGDHNLSQMDNLSGYLMIIPQSTATISIKGEYQIAGDEARRKIDVILNGQDLTAFVAGYAYQFILEIKTSEIKFNVEVVDWSEYAGPLNSVI